ncbi:membrane protein [Marinomonas ushuaiensis DSM 15871]|uniref:Membrane protein n=1 Tax=Marinomonas ushuaiensis DSM 15871 TaxID=1122207 RepID=X7E9C2_9GAMM|nr:YhdP family protein [Marinomonas ushuaiensis]ETX11796.1 membrane protein [Marinomonas ushuaiensis DSM 15871]
MSWLLRKIFLTLFWGGVVFSCLIAVFAVSVGQLLPYLDYYRPQIERNLQQITGYAVSLEQIDGRLEGVDPTVSVGGFHLQANGKSAISIDEMRVRVDLIKSLLSFSPQFTYIRFVGSNVALEESDGQWRLNGAKPLQTVRNEVGVERILDYLSAQRNFSILDATIDIHSAQFGEHTIQIPQVYIFQKEFGSLVKSRLYLDAYEAPFQISARVEDTRLLGGYRVKASIQAPVISLPLREMFPSMPYSLSSVELGGDVWVDALIDKEFEVRAESAHMKFAFEDGQTYETSPSVKLRYTQKHPNLRIDVHDVEIKDQTGVTYPTANLVFDWSSVTNRSSVNFNEVDLGFTHQALSYFLPEKSDAIKLLNGLSPDGTAKNGSFQFWRENDEMSFQLLSNLEAASVKAYNGIPKANKINAIFSLSNDSGYIDFKGKGSEISFDTVYKDSWKTEALSGYVDWRKQQDVFLLTGRDLHIKRNGADVSGGFRLEIREDLPSWISLDLHGNNISALDRLTYIPDNALGEDLRSWIQDGFAEIGQADVADVLIQSDLVEGAVPHVRVRVAASDLDVAFHEDWPTAKKVNGVFEFDNTGVSVQIDTASLLGLPVNNLLITVPINEGAADWLNLQGQLEGEISTILTVLRKTPLKETVLLPFETWEAKGEIKSEFAIGIPFSKDIEPKVNLGLDFQENHLLINNIELASYIKKGRFNYSTNEGITDSTFDVQTLGGASQLQLSSVNKENGRLAVIGDIVGTADLAQVAAWHKLPDTLIEKISGNVAYNGKLLINKTQEGQVDLTINSDLVGVNIDLPEPIGKKAEEAKKLHLKVMQHESDIVIDTDYNQLSKARFLLQNGEFIGGEIILNGGQNQTLNSAISKGLVLTGSFDHVYVQEWQSAFADLSSPASKGVEIPKLPEWINKIDLIVDEVVMNPQNTLNNFKVNYSAASDKSLYVSSDEVNFSFLEKGGIPDLHFDFLSWNTAPSEDSDIVPSDRIPTEAPITASQIPNMTVSVDQLYIDEQPYGDWQLKVSRDGDSVRVRVDPVSTKLKKGDFNGSLVWLDKGEESSVALLIAANGADLSELTGKFSSEAFVSSKKYKINVALDWEGHPFYFDRQSVAGRISFSAEDGNFNKVDELPAFLKFLGVFNAGALTRRLSLDFSDMYQPGLTYDDFSGELSLGDGILKTTSPITVDSPSAVLSLAGKANIVEEIFDETLTATFPLTGALPLAGLLWGTPQLAGLLYITDKLIGDQLSKVTSVQYKIEGSFNNPTMTPIKYNPLEVKK